MESVLWYILPLGIAVALSIFPILAAVLLLLSKDPVRSSLAYAIGWSLGVIVLVTAFALCAQLIPAGASDRFPFWVHYLEIAAGVFLVIDGVFAIVRGRHHRAQTAVPEPPAWVRVASGFTPPRAFGFGLLMNVRPKNLTLTLAAGVAVGAAPIDAFSSGIAVVAFTIVGISSVVALVAAYLLGPERVRPLLTRLNGWLVSNASLVLQISIVSIGVVLVAVGISALSAG